MPSVHDSKMCHQCDSRTEELLPWGVVVFAVVL